MPSMLEKFAAYAARKGWLGTATGTSITSSSWGSTPRRGAAEILTSYATCPSLRDAVSAIAFGVASAKWELHVMRSKGGKAIKAVEIQRATGAERRRLLAKGTSDGKIETITDHPLLALLARPHPLLSGLSARKMTQVCLDLVGESFWRLDFNKLNVPTGFWPLSPAQVQEVPGDADGDFKVSTSTGGTETVPWEQMIWFRDVNPSDPGGRGCGIGLCLGDEVETDEYAAKFAKTFFVNRAKPELLIAVEGAKQDAIEAAKAKYEAEQRGWWNGHKTFWHNGQLKVTELTRSMADLEFAELRRAQRDIIGTTFGVPPEIRGIVENSNRATIDSAELIFARHVLVPRLELWQAELQDRLVPLFDDRLVISYVSPVPDDRDYELRALQSQPQVATRREWRAMAGLPDRGEIDEVHDMPYTVLPTKPGKLPDRQMEGAPAKSTGIVTKDRLVSDRQIERVVSAIDKRPLAKWVVPVEEDEFNKWVIEAHNDLGVNIDWNLVNPYAEEHLREFSSTRITGLVDENTKQMIRDQLADGLENGESIEDLADRVRSAYAVSEQRAELIARTEVIRSSNFGTFVTHKLSGIVTHRAWVATPDDRVREEHWALDSTIAKLDEPFTINGQPAMFPGDFGDPSQDCNCRCTTVPVFGDAQESGAELVVNKPAAAAAWKKFDANVSKWETRMRKAALAGLLDQRAEVLSVLRDISRGG